MRKLKICGLTEKKNIEMVQRYQPDYLGFIFYPPSPRYIAKWRTKEFMETIKQIPSTIKRCGVFVDASLADILEVIKSFDLQVIQLHGKESPAFCTGLKTLCNLPIIKAFGIDENFDFQSLKAFNEVADYFLFDTQTQLKGGSGKMFDWTLLANYQEDKPYFLSGGIGLSELDQMSQLKDERCFAIDVNSKLESAPGIKDPEKVKDFINKWNSLADEFIKN